MKLQIINVVWGKEYINTFLDLSLPTQLSSGNLRELLEKPDYIIYTNESGKEQIKSSQIYQNLEASTHVSFKLIEIPSGKCPFKILLESHSNAIKEANSKDAPLIFLSPDCILSTGVFTYCEQALMRGKRLIAVCSSRMSLESYQEFSQEKKANSQDGVVTWSPQELAVTTVKNLHHRAKCLMMSEGNIGGHPSHMYWKLDDNNLLAKAYHLHPLLFWPEKHGVYPTISADGKDFLERAYTSFSKWEVIQDCNQISLFEVSRDDQFSEDRFYPTEFFSLKFWLKQNTSKAHQYFYKHDIILGDGQEKPEWKEKIKAAHGLIKKLHRSKPSNSKVFAFNIPNFRPVLHFYKALIRQVLSGRKKLTFRKVFHHFYFLIRYRSPPYHTVDFSEIQSKKAKG